MKDLLLLKHLPRTTKIPNLVMLENILLSPPFEVADMNTNVGARPQLVAACSHLPHTDSKLCRSVNKVSYMYDAGKAPSQ